MFLEILNKSFKVPPDKEVKIKDCITLNKGNIIGLWGANGIGKSTLIKELYSEFSANQFNIIRPSTEGIKWKIGIIPQNIHEIIFPWLKVDKIIDVFKSNFNSLNENIIIDGVTNCSKKVKNLSGGEKQALAFELILNFGFDVLFLDEPFSAMDFERIKIYCDKLNKYIDKNGAIVFIVVHDFLILQNLSDFILVYSQKENTVIPLKNEYKKDKIINNELVKKLYL